jgi:hypothetical protein
MELQMNVAASDTVTKQPRRKKRKAEEVHGNDFMFAFLYFGLGFLY